METFQPPVEPQKADATGSADIPPWQDISGDSYKADDGTSDS